MAKKRILITGANGLLGQSILHANQGRFDLAATGRGVQRGDLCGAEYYMLDTTNAEDYQRAFAAFSPDVVIHAAAMTQVDDCELQPELCHQLNVEATQRCIEACEAAQIHLIFISTDFIFDGSAGPYSEEAAAAPLSIYGQSKADAEALVMKAECPWTIARTVLVIGYVPGLSRSNIILWARGALSRGERIRVVDDQVRSPTWSMDLAEGCLLIAQKHATGIYHLSGPDTMSIFELVQQVAQHGGYDVELMDRVSSDTLAQAAKRPPITGFDIRKAEKDLGYHPHTFQEVLDVIPYI
ncbi:SDR family oxidoreductase [Schleiferiaceae bacterium]|jgi:dTDP-4-dehydrorhamnose reductase|nr:SDR family oxidoreductase [Schleiferiaceae bacterium]MDA9151584.1 SDR family oxidoreductase [Schleiferiaceae bacterium]MDC3353834.1 SDR family oxidoreductase [Schleiferiaceae bacterium]